MKKFLSLSSLIFCILFISSTRSSSQWTRATDPWRETIHYFAIDGTNLFVGTGSGGAFRSITNISLPPPTQPVTKYLFHIPVYPGTEEYRTPFNDEGLHMPFATVYKVFRTGNGDSLNSQAVIKFFEDYLRAKGWKEGIDNGSQHEPYLAMTIDLRENLPDHTNIFLAGHFYLWVAPKDGMYTILCKQWRTSSPGQEAYNREYRIIDSIKSIGRDMGYTIGGADFWRSDWEDFYENEYLVTWDHIYLYKARDIATTVEILIYKDSLVAQQEVEKFINRERERSWATVTPLNQRAYFVDFKKIITTGGNKLIVSFSKFVILMEATSLSQGETLKTMFKRLDAIEK